jgi:transposase
MAAAYSRDLGERVINDADAGLSSKELAERYHVSRAWVDALKQRRRETGSIAPRPQTKFRRRHVGRPRIVSVRWSRCSLTRARRGARSSAHVRRIGDDLARAESSWISPSKKPSTRTNSADVAVQRRQWRG